MAFFQTEDHVSHETQRSLPQTQFSTRGKRFSFCVFPYVLKRINTLGDVFPRSTFSLPCAMKTFSKPAPGSGCTPTATIKVVQKQTRQHVKLYDAPSAQCRIYQTMFRAQGLISLSRALPSKNPQNTEFIYSSIFWPLWSRLKYLKNYDCISVKCVIFRCTFCLVQISKC